MPELRSSLVPPSPGMSSLQREIELSRQGRILDIACIDPCYGDSIFRKSKSYSHLRESRKMIFCHCELPALNGVMGSEAISIFDQKRIKPMSTHLAASITKAASQQSYYTIRCLVDRPRVEDAYRAYAYFRWVDDLLDAPPVSGFELSAAEASARQAFLERQKFLLESCYRGEPPHDITPQEKMLVELIGHDPAKNSGLRDYLRNMMLVMDFDAKRRGRLVSQVELNDYTHWLAVAVTEALHFFIGQACSTPTGEARYLAVSAAHITHMLRDTFADIQAGYFNIPREALEADHIGPQDVHTPAYRHWVKGRVQLARQQFEAGRDYFHLVQSARCRLACFAYIARFDWLLDTIEREGYILRPEYPERKSPSKALRMGWLALSTSLNFSGGGAPAQRISSRSGEKI